MPVGGGRLYFVTINSRVAVALNTFFPCLFPHPSALILFYNRLQKREERGPSKNLRNCLQVHLRSQNLPFVRSLSHFSSTINLVSEVQNVNHDWS